MTTEQITDTTYSVQIKRMIDLAEQLQQVSVMAVEVCGSTRTRGYGSGTGRCLTGRVGYGYEVHGSGIPVFYP